MQVLVAVQLRGGGAARPGARHQGAQVRSDGKRRKERRRLLPHHLLLQLRGPRGRLWVAVVEHVRGYEDNLAHAKMCVRTFHDGRREHAHAHALHEEEVRVPLVRSQARGVVHAALQVRDD